MWRVGDTGNRSTPNLAVCYKLEQIIKQKQTHDMYNVDTTIHSINSHIHNVSTSTSKSQRGHREMRATSARPLQNGVALTGSCGRRIASRTAVSGRNVQEYSAGVI